MNRRIIPRLVLPLAALATLGGCGSDGYVLAPVSGRVTVDGQPVAGLRIAFEPMGSADRPVPGPESIGITDDDGRFVAATMAESPRRGAVVGKCRVRIWTLPPGQEAEVSDDRADDYDPVREVKEIRDQLRSRGRKKAADRPAAALPLRYNDNTELSFDVPPDGTDAADFSIAWK